MGLFDKIQQTAKNVGSSVSKTAGKISSSVAVSTQEQSELVSLRSQINVINQDLDAAYMQIGRKYVEYVLQHNEMPAIDVSDILKMIDPKITKKQELENQIVQIEKEIKQKTVLQEKASAEEKFIAEKQKLDKALAMEIITQGEYFEKISIARKRIDNFDEIRRIEQQAEIGVITEEEKKEKIKALTE